MRTIQTACTYDCPDACCLQVSVDGEGRAVKIRGDRDHPITGGFVCHRVHRHPRLLRHAERITSPMRRVGSEWQALGWDEALALCVDQLQHTLDRHGPPGVLHLAGGGSLGVGKELVGHFFRSLGPITTVCGGVCGEAGEAAQRADFGDCACHDYTDLQNCAAVVLWGKNPVATGVHLVPFINHARDRGAPVWLINPAPSESHRLADRVVRLRPGGDGWLALAVLGRLREQGPLQAKDQVEDQGAGIEAILDRLDPAGCAARCDVTLDEVDGLARLYAEHRPVATWIGWGLQRTAHGGHAVRCIDALCLLSGQIGVPGGGANFSSRRSRGLDRSMLAGGGGRTVAAPALGQEIAALADPPVSFAYVCGVNPVTQFADSDATREALEDPGRFVVVADAFFTDTARAADLVLPVALMLEDDADAVGSYQHHHVARVRRASLPPEGARDDLWIVRELSRRLGRPVDPVLEDPAGTVERMTAGWFEGASSTAWARNPAQPQVPFTEGFFTPSGKASLVTEPPPAEPDQQGDELTLLSVSSRSWQTSRLLEDDQQEPVKCHVHPETAKRRNLGQDAPARLVSASGDITVRLMLDEAVHPDACVVHRGGWVCCGRGVNVLVAGGETDLGQGTAFYSQRVRLISAE